MTGEREICDIFNEFFSYVAMDIGFKDDIPDDFQTADGFAKIIDKHHNHPSIIKIRENIRTRQYFYFTAANGNDMATIIYPANCYVLGPQVFLLMYLNSWIIVSMSVSFQI